MSAFMFLHIMYELVRCLCVVRDTFTETAQLDGTYDGDPESRHFVTSVKHYRIASALFTYSVVKKKVCYYEVYY